MIMETDIMPTSAHQAKKLKKTYYKSSAPCSQHGTFHRWTHTRVCMACVDYFGEDHMRRNIPDKKLRPKWRAKS